MSLCAAVFSQTNAFSVAEETREVTVHSHGDEVVDCPTAAMKERWPRVVRFLGTSQVPTLDHRQCKP